MRDGIVLWMMLCIDRFGFETEPTCMDWAIVRQHQWYAGTYLYYYNNIDGMIGMMLCIDRFGLETEPTCMD